MFQLDDGLVVLSATDLGSAIDCEFATLRTHDVLRGRAVAADVVPDPLQLQAGRLGLDHETRLREQYEADFPGGVVVAPRPEERTRAAYEDAARATLAALQRPEVHVVYQATVFDGSFFGYADFLVRTSDGRWEVRDTKIARSAKVSALLQTGGYADLLTAARVDLGPTVRLILGDGSSSVHEVRDLVPTFQHRRAHLRALLDAHEARGVAIAWGAPGVRACGRCAVCAPEVQRHRDLFQVAGMTPTHRTALRAAGITTVAGLATTTVRGVPGVGDNPFRRYVEQAEQQERTTGPVPSYVVHAPAQLGAIPAPSPGDLFFDFEGDPLHFEDAEEEREWNLDYLFGVTDAHDVFTPFWAHDFAAEKVALRDFLDLVKERRAAHPDLHVYHYAPYEKAHLLSLAQRHGIGEDEVDDLLRSHVLVDLYPIVRKALRVGSPSYSIKKLEPLYFTRRRTDEEGEEAVTTAVGSVEEYWLARAAFEEGRTEDAQKAFDRIARYNEDDCVSTRQLRDFLLGLAEQRHVQPGSIPPPPPKPTPAPASALIEPLRARAATEQDPERRAAIEVTAAALGYYRRETNAFARGHYDRLLQPMHEWVGTTRGAFDVLHVVSDGGWVGRSRRLRLVGEAAPGTRLRAGDRVVAVYDGDPLFEQEGADPGARSATSVTVVEVHGEGEITVRESLPKGVDGWAPTPDALAPGWPPSAGGHVVAIEEFAGRLLDADGAPIGAAADVLLRRESAAQVAHDSGAEPDHVDAIVSALLASGDGAVAVQGPPGSGKTYVGSHVIARLVEAGWGIGVVAQSHSVIEHLLTKVVDGAGVPKERVGKVVKHDRPVPFTVIPDGKEAGFIAGQTAGFAVGGTAWDFVNPNRVGRRSLDLLVVDEAGQFALANTIAVGESAKRLLLLGDPQQLPQVSQATHPAPADASALGWIMGDAAVLDGKHGVFLERTRRMHPALTDVVSELSYAGELEAHASTSERTLEGVEPGLHAVAVVHEGNRSASAEEAAAVVRIVQDLSGSTWTDTDGSRALGDGDFIVVTPYNAQVGCIEDALRAAGHPGVVVGTVDKFQGREAPVAIVSLAASTAVDAPRGMGFLLNRNRLNVAISRAKWAAYLVHSPVLADHVPRTARSVADLSGFLGVIGRSVQAGAARR